MQTIDPVVNEEKERKTRMCDSVSVMLSTDKPPLFLPTETILTSSNVLSFFFQTQDLAEFLKAQQGHIFMVG